MRILALVLLIAGSLMGCAAVPVAPAPGWPYTVRITGPDQAVWLEGDIEVPADKGVEVTVREPHCGQKGATPAIALKILPQTRPVFRVWLAVGDAQGRCAVVDQVMDLAPGQVALLALPVSMGVHAQISRPGPPVITPRHPYLAPPSPQTMIGRAALSAP